MSLIMLPQPSEKLTRNEAALELLLRRRSLVAAKQTGPGPTPEELDVLLRCATRVPLSPELAANPDDGLIFNL